MAKKASRTRRSKKATAKKSVGKKPTARKRPTKKKKTAGTEFSLNLPRDSDEVIAHSLTTASESYSSEPLGDFLPGFKSRQTSQEFTSFRSARKNSESALDAWHGSFGTVGSSAMAAAFNRRSSTLQQRRMETGYSTAIGSDSAMARELHAEVVIGNDDRVEIADPIRYPYGCICQLDIFTQSKRAYVGTGWLISPTTVVTAGHCIFAHKEGGWVNEIAVHLGRRGTSTPIVRQAVSLHSVLGWVRDRQPAADYGVIKLDQPIENVGLIGFQSSPDEDLQRYRCHVIGYPADKRKTMWGDTTRLQYVKSRTVTYEIDTYGGQSGSPVLVFEDGMATGVGIHNYGDLRGNSATRITDTVFDNLVRWQDLS